MDTSEQCKEVYAHFGLAMYRVQCVEQSIIQLLIFFDFFPAKVPRYTSTEQWEADFDSFTGDLSSKTMGQLMKKLRDTNAIDAKRDVKLRDALKKRNWLAHSFFADHALTFLSEEGRLEMVKQLEECTSYFGEVEDILNPITYTARNMASRKRNLGKLNCSYLRRQTVTYQHPKPAVFFAIYCYLKKRNDTYEYGWRFLRSVGQSA